MCFPQTRRTLLCLIMCLITTGPCQGSQQWGQNLLAWLKPKTSAAASWLHWDNIFHQASYECLARALVRHPKTSIAYKEALPLVYLVSKEAHGDESDTLQMLAIIVVESGAKKHAVSEKNARGLMQILPTTGAFIAKARGEKWNGSQSLFDPATNIKYGAWYILHLRDMFGGNYRAALAAYNWGPGVVRAKMKAGEELPHVYAHQVEAEEQWLRKEWYNEHVAYFWRRVDQLERDLRNYGDTGESEDRASTSEVSVLDGEGLSSVGG
jgi:hypothetical protein